MSDSVLKINGKEYQLPIEEILADLTGAESIMLEDYLGGWDNFDIRGATTRSVIVLVWLAKHHAGEKVEITDIEAMRGLVFGDAVEVEERPPEMAADAASDSSQETSETNGAPPLPVETVGTA